MHLFDYNPCENGIVDLRHVRAFVAIADAGGFARATARLNLSQPAISRQISALERELGVRLFDRVGRRIQLTSEGEDILRRGRRLLLEADSLGERARALRHGEGGVLRVGATPQNLENLLAVFLTHYRRRHPGVEVHLVEEGAIRLPDRLDRGEVHLALIAAGDDRFPGRLLYPIYLLAILPATHRWSRRAVLEVSELADSPLLLLRREFGSRTWLDAACHVARIETSFLLESSAPHTLIALARAGYGIAVVPSNVQVPGHGLRAVPLVQRGAPIGRWATVAWDPRRFLAPYAERFVHELVAHTQRAYPGRNVTRRAPPLPRPKRPT